MPPATPRPVYDRIDLIPDRLGRVQRVGIRGGRATMLGFETMAGGAGDDLFSDIVAEEAEAPRETAQAPAVIGPAVPDLFGDLMQAEPETGLFDDILTGALDIPKQVAGGALDALEQAADTMEQIVPLGTFEIGEGGIRHRAVEPKAERGVPKLGPAKSNVGALTRGVSQFLTGFIPALKGIKALGVLQGGGALSTLAQSELASQIAEQLVFDPKDPRLSNLVQQFPALQNPVTEYLQADPDDTEAEARFKMALEGAGMGVLTGAFMGIIGAARRAGVKGAEKAAGEAAETVAEAGARTAPEAGQEAAEALPDFLRNVDVDKLHYDNGLSEIADKAGIAHKPGTHKDVVIRLLKEKYPALRRGDGDPLKGFVDTRGSGERFHGTSDEIADVQEFTYGTKNIYGQGFYTTDAVDIASGYQKKGGGKAPTVYRVTETGAPRMFDLDQPINEQFRRAASEAAGGPTDTFAWALDALDEAETPRQWFDEVRDLSAGEGQSADTVQELFDSLQQNLAKDGYRGYHHKGGALTGRSPHDVNVYWFPKEDIKLERVDPLTYRATEPTAPPAGPATPRPTVQPLAEGQADDFMEALSRPPEAQPKVPPPTGPMAGNVNLGFIRSGQDVKRVIEETAKAFEGQLDAARRGTVTNAETRKLASDLGMTYDDLLKRQRGQAFNAEQALAARRLLVRSADTVQKLAQAAKGGSDEALAAFQEALTRHVAIQEQVAGLTAEAGRALQAFQIPAQGAVRARVIRDMIERAGGRDSIESVAEKIATLTDEAAVNEASRLAFKPRLRDKLFEVWINALLSGPQTHAVNFLSNALTQVWTIPEHMLAAGFGKLRGGTDKVFLREVPAKIFGMSRGSVDGVVAAGKVLRTGESAFDPLTKIEMVRQRSIGGVAGRLIRAPSTLLQASDDFFKSTAYRAEMNSLALRDGIKRGLEGEALAKHVDGLLREPSEEIAEQALKYARKVTFTSPMGPAASAAARFFNSFPMGRVILPFIRTPGNIVKFAAERSPLGFLMREVRDEIAKGGAARDLALARIGMGTTVGVAVATMAAEGGISGGGPSDPGAKAMKRATGWQPYSIKIGNTWYSYNRLEPLGLLLGVAADVAEISGHLSDEESERLGSLIVGSISKNLLSKTWLRGPSELIEAWRDPERYGSRWLQSVAGTLVPTGVAQVARVQDPVLRSADPEAIDDPLLAEAQVIINKIKSRLPGYSEELPPVRNVWGEPVLLEGGLGPDLISPVYSSTDKHDTTTEELIRLKVYPSFLKHEINGVKLTPRQYDRYAELAGKTAKQALDRLVGSDGWQRLPDFQRAELAETVIREARDQVKEIMLINEPDILQRKTKEQIEDINKKLEELRGEVGRLAPELQGVPFVPAAGVRG